MSARGIEGKPGSGKSCYAVYLITLLLGDWARYKKQEKAEYPRKLYTNIPLDVEAINVYLRSELGFDVDMGNQIVLLDDDFFLDENDEFAEWWKKFPEAAFIVIDEFQELLSSSSKRDAAGKDHTERFMKYIAKHRHLQQDIILLSQSLKNITIEARRMFDSVSVVLNVKNTTLGRWPFSIPMADIDIVRESWGMPQQMAHIRKGHFEQEKIVYEKSPEIFLLQTKIFRLYKSHTMSSATLDRPSLKLGKIGSIFWIARKHGIRLTIATAVSGVLLYGFLNAIRNFPSTMMSVMQPGVAMAPESPPTTMPGNIVTEPGQDPRVPATTQNDDTVIGFVRDGVITPRGVLRKNDAITFEGEKDTVQNIDVLRGILYLGSGKKLQK